MGSAAIAGATSPLATASASIAMAIGSIAACSQWMPKTGMNQPSSGTDSSAPRPSHSHSGCVQGTGPAAANSGQASQAAMARGSKATSTGW